MNDKYQVGQAGAVGPVSKARENFFARAWDVQRSQIDLDVLVRELGEVRDKGRALVQGRNEYVAIAELHHAEHAGRRGDGPGVLSHLALAGDWALGIAIAIDARMVTEAFEAATGAEPRWPRPQAEDGHYPDSPIGAGTRDRYIVNQAGSVGPGSTAHHTSFGRTGGEPDIDRQALRGDLAILRVAMRKEATELAHDIAVGEIAAAEIAAAKGDDSNMLNHLAKTGHWALGIASAIGATLAAEVIKKALGI